MYQGTYLHQYFKIFILILFYGVILSCSFSIKLISPQIDNGHAYDIYNNSQLSEYYDDTKYNDLSTCTSGQLSVIQFLEEEGNGDISFSYDGLNLTEENIFISSSFQIPNTTVKQITNFTYDNGNFTLSSGCLGKGTNPSNYFNKVKVIIKSQFKDEAFTFLLGCSKGGRQKRFQIGYVIIAIINAVITIGVALHSRIWSLRYNRKPLSIQLSWKKFIILMTTIIVFGIIIYFQAADQFMNSNLILRYVGLAVSLIFTFICADQTFFLVRKFKMQVYKFIRICDILSLIFSLIMFIVGFFTESWIFYDILAIAICVGAIKLLRFSSMKQAFLSMGISVFIVTITSSILHYILQRSYNDYASELASPLFILIPDIIDELFKKCSWLPVIDLIVPGVFLSFLRTYDENYNTGWGGVYTVIGNLSFILSTILWVLLQVIYPFSIPFSLVTYISLSLTTFLVSYQRNEFKTLWQGRFNGANNDLASPLMEEDDKQEEVRKSFGKMVGKQIIDEIKCNDDQSVDEEENNKKKETEK